MYTGPVSVKYQIVLPDALAVELKRMAEQLKVPRAQLVRDAVEARLKAYRSSRSQDPFSGISGLVESGESEVSSRLDEILYE